MSSGVTSGSGPTRTREAREHVATLYGGSVAHLGPWDGDYKEAFASARESLYDAINDLEARADDAERLLRQTQDALRERARAGHNDTCGAVISTPDLYPCTCGHAGLLAVLAAAVPPEADTPQEPTA